MDFIVTDITMAVFLMLYINKNKKIHKKTGKFQKKLV